MYCCLCFEKSHFSWCHTLQLTLHWRPGKSCPWKWTFESYRWNYLTVSNTGLIDWTRIKYLSNVGSTKPDWYFSVFLEIFVCVFRHLGLYFSFLGGYYFIISVGLLRLFCCHYSWILWITFLFGDTLCAKTACIVDAQNPSVTHYPWHN